MNFKRSVLTFISFFTSLIVFKVLSGKDLDGDGKLFSPEAIMLSKAFLIIVFIYLLFSNWEVGKEKERFIASYLRLRNSYQDLLDEDDLNSILNNDAIHNADKAYITQKRKAYNILWTIVIVVFVICISMLS